MNFNDKLNEAVENRQKFNSVEEAIDNSGKTQTRTLGMRLNPSQFLPIRTARYWADVEMAKDVKINFFKKLKNGFYEVHNNASDSIWKIVDKLSFHQVLKETAFELSYTGESDIAIFRRDKNVVPLKMELIKKQYHSDGSLMYYHGLVNFDAGTAPWIMTKKFYYNEVNEVVMENIAYEKRFTEGSDDQPAGESWEEIDIGEFNNKYNQDFSDKKVLGKIIFPVITMTNTGADRWGSGTSDTEEVKDVLMRLDTIEDAIDRAIKTSKTRLYNKRKNGSIDMSGASPTNNATTRQILDDVDVIDVVEDPHNAIDGQLQVSDRNLNVDQWYVVKKSLLQDYYSHTGENVAADAHGNNQHTYEVQSKGDNKYRRGTAKRNQRKKEIKQLMEMIVSFATTYLQINSFAGLDEIVVDIDETDIRKEYQIEDKVEKLLSLGLISKVQALMKIEDIDELTAMNMITQKMKHEEIEPEEENEVIDNNPNDDGEVVENDD